jgi:hypothetical protein
VLGLVLGGCQFGATDADHQRVLACLNQYHPATPDPMPTDSEWTGFQFGLTYAVPCDALTPQGDGRWEVLVVAPDDRTIRIYFIGGTTGDRSGLLRNVTVAEAASEVSIRIESGGDTVGPGSAGSAVGQNYVTQITLSRPLAGRKLSGPNNRGVVEHL